MEAGTILAIVELGLKALSQSVRVYNSFMADENCKDRVWQLHEALQTFIDHFEQARAEVDDIENKAKFLKSTSDTILECTKFLDQYDPAGNGPSMLQRGLLTMDDTRLRALHERINRHQTQLSVFITLELNRISRRDLKRRQTVPAEISQPDSATLSPMSAHPSHSSWYSDNTPSTLVEAPSPIASPRTSSRFSSTSAASSRSGHASSRSGGSIASSGGPGCVSLSLKYYKESWDFPLSSGRSHYSSESESMSVEWFHPDLMFTLIHEVPLNEYGIPTSRLSHGKSGEIGFLPIHNVHCFKILVNGEVTRLTDVPTYRVRKGVDSLQFQSLLRGRALLGSYRVSDVVVGKSEGGEGEVKIWESLSDPRHPTISFAYRPKKDFVHREFTVKSFDADAELHIRGDRLTIRKWGEKKGFSLVSKKKPLYEGYTKPPRHISVPSPVTFIFDSEEGRKQFLQTSVQAHKRDKPTPPRAQSMASTQATLVNQPIYEVSAGESTISPAVEYTSSPTTEYATSPAVEMPAGQVPFNSVQWGTEQNDSTVTGIGEKNEQQESDYQEALSYQYATTGYPYYDLG